MDASALVDNPAAPIQDSSAGPPEFFNKSNVDSTRFLGLSLGGPKSDKTSLIVLDYFSNQKKTFVIDAYCSVGFQNHFHEDDLTSDQILIELIEEVSLDSLKQKKQIILAVDAPLTLPPCLIDCSENCDGYEKCERASVRWMQDFFHDQKRIHKKLRHITPYSQRPVDLFYRCKFHGENLFQDEALGSNLAPQTARMQYLRREFERRFEHLFLIETWPKLALYEAALSLKLNKQDALAYRNLEEGINTREKIMNAVIDHLDFFIYDGDRKKILAETAAFDAFVCSWMALLFYQNKVKKTLIDFPVDSGWVYSPQL